MMSLTFGLFTQVSGSGPLGPLVMQEAWARLPSGCKPNYYFQFNKAGDPSQVCAVIPDVRVAVSDISFAERRRWSKCHQTGRTIYMYIDTN